MLHELTIACEVCEAGSVLDRHKHIIFEDGTLRAFNGLVSFEAPSAVDATEKFAVNEMKLSVALRSCAGDNLLFSTTKDFLVMKRGRLSVRVRKLDPEMVMHSRIERPPQDQRIAAGTLHEALRAVRPFISSDATRPWSVSAWVHDGWVWATNNLAIVRFPLDKNLRKLECRLPGAAVSFFCELESFDWISIAEFVRDDGSKHRKVMVEKDEVIFSVPETADDWPSQAARMFEGWDSDQPPIDAELVEASKVIEKLSDRFITLTSASLTGKSQTIESEYEIVVKTGKGTYNARLLSLILSHAATADFSPYPKPIRFKGDKLQGIAVGVDPKAV